MKLRSKNRETTWSKGAEYFPCIVHDQSWRIYNRMFDPIRKDKFHCRFHKYRAVVSLLQFFCRRLRTVDSLTLTILLAHLVFYLIIKKKSLGINFLEDVKLQLHKINFTSEKLPLLNILPYLSCDLDGESYFFCFYLINNNFIIIQIVSFRFSFVTEDLNVLTWQINFSKTRLSYSLKLYQTTHCN